MRHFTLARNSTRNLLYKMSGSNRRVYSHREKFLQIVPRESVGVELGVFKGEFSKQILEIVRPRELHLIDVWWTQFGEYYPNWGEYTDYGRLKTRDAYANAMMIIEKYSAKTNVTVHVGDDLKYLGTLPDGYLDWSYLDSSHEYEHTKLELEILRDKTKSGGLITGDDWQEDTSHIHYGVSQAVKEFCGTYKWKIVLLDNHRQWAIQQCR